MGNPPRPRVLLADDHPLILESLERLLTPEFEIVGKAASGTEALALGERLRPHLAIFDIAMPGLDGTEVTRRLMAANPNLKVLILSLHQQPLWVRRAFDAGAAGYLCKSSASAEVVLAAKEVLAGRCFISAAITKKALLPWPQRIQQEPVDLVRPAEPTQPESLLTAREAEIVELLALSLGNKEIAHHLDMSVATVRTHLNNIYKKLGLDSRVGLALYAEKMRRTAG